MKSLKIIVLLVVLLLLACHRDPNKGQVLKEIQQIENGLLPKVIIYERAQEYQFTRIK